jgi:hypothetical protein
LFSFLSFQTCSSSILPEPDVTMFASSKEKYDTFDDNVDAVETTELLRPITNYSPRRRCKSLTRCIYSLFVFLALCIIALFALGMSLFWGAVTPPFRDPPKDWSRFRNQTWAVGIDLSAGYITAAIAFNNGTIINIEMTQQSPPYNDVLARLSLESSVHPT